MDSARLHSTRLPSESDAQFDENIPVLQSTDATLVRDIASLVSHLQLVYGTAVALDLALRAQGAERDADLADCLRFGVIESTASQLEKAQGLLRRLERTSTAAA